MLVLDGEKKPHAVLVRGIIKVADVSNARLHMQLDTGKITLQNKGVQGIERLVIKTHHASHFKVLFYVACPLTSLLS